MDPIYEAYNSQVLIEAASKYTLIKNSVTRPLGSAIEAHAKKIGSIVKGVYYKEGNLSNLDLRSELIKIKKIAGSDKVWLAIISDRSQNRLQIIFNSPMTKKYGSHSYFYKANSFDEITNIIKNFSKDIKSNPSTKDVNGPLNNNPDWRL